MYKTASLRLLCSILGMPKEASMQKQADPNRVILDAQRGSQWRGTNAGLGLTPDQQRYILNQPSRRVAESTYEDFRQNNVINDAAAYYAENRLRPNRAYRNYEVNPRINAGSYGQTMRALEPAYYAFEERVGHPELNAVDPDKKNVMSAFWNAVHKRMVPKPVK